MESTSVGAIPAAACFLAIVFLYSQYNSRSTEDLTHPLWNIFLFRLCEKHITSGRLIPTPQYRIWATKVELNDFADSDATGTDDVEEESVEDEEGIDAASEGEYGSDSGAEGERHPSVAADEHNHGGTKYEDQHDGEPEGEDHRDGRGLEKEHHDGEAEDEDDYDYDPTCDMSMNTTAQPADSILEVIADYVVLVPQIRLHVQTPIAWLDRNPNLAKLKKNMLQLLSQQAQFLDALSYIFPTWTTAQAFRVYMPLLVELKRPISRNPASSSQQTTHINSRLKEAMEQVEEQALCMFKSGKFAHQQWAFLIAATGDFWRFRKIERGPGKKGVERKFDKAKYARFMEEEAERNSEGTLESEETFTGKLINETRAAAKETITNAGDKRVFSVEELNESMEKKNKASKAPKRQTFNNSQEWIASKSLYLSEDIVGSSYWSPVLKIGTEASQSAFSYLSGQLDKFVSENGVIIT